MTKTDEPAPTPTVSRRRWIPWAVAAVAIVIAAVAVSIAVFDNRGPDTDRQLSTVRSACAQWNDQYGGTVAPPTGWCDDMTGWMNGRTTNGRARLDDVELAQQMRAACQEWMAANTTSTENWCDNMVDWMTQHWDHGWMMGGRNMMGDR